MMQAIGPWSVVTCLITNYTLILESTHVFLESQVAVKLPLYVWLCQQMVPKKTMNIIFKKNAHYVFTFKNNVT